MLPRKLLVDVGHDDHDDAGHEHSLHESPEDELLQVLRGCRQQRRNGQRVKRGTITFLRPTDSASSPMNGAVSATARIVALTVR